jgi:hypothetical protein
VGASWTTTTDATGKVMSDGSQVDLATYPTTEKYDSKVDAAGEVKTPFGTFEALRVNTLLTRKVYYLSKLGILVKTETVRTFAFVTECFGTIASVASNTNEATEEFTTAAELRRLAP